MFTIASDTDVQCCYCVGVIPPSHIIERENCFYQFQCTSARCTGFTYFKCRICTPSKYSPKMTRGRLSGRITAHKGNKSHEAAMLNYRDEIVDNMSFDDSPNDFNDDGADIEEHGVSMLDPVNAIICPGCPTSPNLLDHTQQDTTITGNLVANTSGHSIPFDSLAISSNADYIAAMRLQPEPLLIDIISKFPPDLQSYFDACINNVGHKFITQLAITGRPNTKYSDEKASTSLYILLLSKLCIELKVKQRAILATLLSYVHHSATQPNLNTFVPACGNDIRNKLLDGIPSVKKNLPIPKIVKLPEGFVYISMESTIRHQFCSEHPPNEFLPFSHSVHAHTPRGKELLNPSVVLGSILQDRNNSGHPILPIKIIPWTDDFQPFSVIKSTGSSASLGMVTIGALDGDHSGRHCHLLWIGPAKSSTTAAEKMFADELNKLTQRPFLVYSRQHKCVVDVKPKLYAFLADRPDKSKRLSLLNGGNTHACWSYAGEFYDVIDQAVLCPRCYAQFMNNPDIGSNANTPCAVCFSMDLSLMKYKIPTNYPEDMRPPSTSPQLLPIKKVTIEGLKAACLISFNRIKEKRWTHKAFECYLKCEGVNKEFLNSIYVNGLRAHLELSQAGNASPELLEELQSDPASFRMPNFPPLWEISEHVGVAVFVDCIMHMLFLGTYKKLNTILLVRFLTPIHKLGAGSKFVNAKLNCLTLKSGIIQHLDHASLSYLPLHPICGTNDMKYGNWLSKNWISHQRISKWIHADLPDYGTQDFNTTDLGKDFSLYSLAQLKKWCKKRRVVLPTNVDFSVVTPARAWFVNVVNDYPQLFSGYTEDDIFHYIDGKVSAEEYEQVQKMNSRDCQAWFDDFVTKGGEYPPEIPPQFNVHSARKGILELISLHLCIVSRVMYGCSGKSVGRHVKLFLTIYHRIDKQIGPATGPNSISVIRQMNLITLLNLEPTIERFGPLRYLWEGGGMGEGSIPKVKQFIRDMKPKFANNAALSHLQKVALDTLLASAYKEVETEKDSKDNVDQKEMYDRLLRSATETIEKESNRNGVSDSFIGSGKLEEPFSGIDKGGDTVSIYNVYDALLSCPLRRQDECIPVVIDLVAEEVFIVIKDKTLVMVHLSYQDHIELLDGCYFHATITGTKNWVDKKRGNLVCGLMLRHSSQRTHYYVIAMNWLEAVLVQGQVAFRLPRFKGATYEDGVDEKSADQFLKTHNNDTNKRSFQETAASDSAVI